MTSAAAARAGIASSNARALLRRGRGPMTARLVRQLGSRCYETPNRRLAGAA